jgi:hypothetical protein
MVSSHDREWFIPPINMVMTGEMVYDIALPCFTYIIFLEAQVAIEV